MRFSRTTRSTICVIEGRCCEEWARLLPPGGRVLYKEALVLTGAVSNDEVKRRTFMGFFVLTPAGANERAIDEAGLVLERAEDRSDPVARLGARMRAARQRYRSEILPLGVASTR